jgi:hypothetical protein
LRLHFLPSRFVKIRHYGLLANRGRQARLPAARALLQAQSPTGQPLPELKPTPLNSPTLPVCPHCGWAALVLVRIVAPLRLASPPTLDSS